MGGLWITQVEDTFMKVIWKRPDGFHQASPSDYIVVDISSHSRLWLHKTDQENFPFRVSGGWQDEKATRKLNRLVNLLTKSSTEWIRHLTEIFEDSKTEDGESFLKTMVDWLGDIKRSLKGDTWEVDIMNETINQVLERVESVTAPFLAEVKR